MLTAEEWINNFKKQKKRNPRILHIGNIANNAYQNAKNLNAMGYDCDVLSVDYYHVGACPEWADAEFRGEIKDFNFPDWKNVNLHGFKRPKWFVAGPMSLSIRYLMARSKGWHIRKWIYWKMLIWARNNIADTHDMYDYKLLKLERAIKKQETGYFIYVVKKVLKLLPFFGMLKKKENSIKVKDFEEIQEEFKYAFPDRESRFEKDILIQFFEAARMIKPLLEQYDIIVGYAVCPYLPYLAGVNNYVAYEHGTIRKDVIDKDDDFTKLYILSYAKARAIYSTNIDCYDSAKYIAKYTKVPIVCGLHGIDIDGIVKKMRKAENVSGFDGRLGIPKERTVFFCPSRHDYDADQHTFLKGDEKMLEAAAKLARDVENFVLVLVDLGNSVDKVKKTIYQDKGLRDKVLWIKMVNQLELFKIYQNVDAVLDQFFWRAYGGITFEVLAAGSSALISNAADRAYTLEYFGAYLPYFACETVEDIYRSMKEVVEKSDRYKEYIKTSQEWVCKYHSKEKIANCLSKTFQYCL